MEKLRRARSPRFKIPDKLPTVHLTADDGAIIWYTYRRTLIDSHCLYDLFPHRSRQHLSRRLNTLRKARFIGRLPQQVEEWRHREGGGTTPFVYYLDYRGARWLNQEHGVQIRIDGRRYQHERLSWKNVPHTLGVTRFMVDHELAARSYPTIDLIEFDELLARAPKATRQRPQPERFQTEVTWQGNARKEGIRPDEVFALRNREAARGDRTMYYLLEEDHETETIVPGAEVRSSEAFFRQSSIYRKFLVYTHAYRNHVAREWFGFDRAFRVLFVTGSRTRRENMQEAFQEHFMLSPIKAKAGVHLFADKRMMAQYADDILAMPWQNERGEVVFIDGRGGEVQ